MGRWLFQRLILLSGGEEDNPRYPSERKANFTAKCERRRESICGELIRVTHKRTHRTQARMREGKVQRSLVMVY